MSADEKKKEPNSTPKHYPVFFREDEYPELTGWYFWDECWAHHYGPYETREKAEEECNKYIKECVLPDPPRINSLVRYCGELEYYPDVLNHWKPERGPFLFLGEIPNMPEHCVIATTDGRIHFAFHTDSFEEIPEDEV